MLSLILLNCLCKAEFPAAERVGEANVTVGFYESSLVEIRASSLTVVGFAFLAVFCELPSHIISPVMADPEPISSLRLICFSAISVLFYVSSGR